MILRQNRSNCRDSPVHLFAKDTPTLSQRATLLRLLTQTLQRHRVCPDPVRTLTLLEKMILDLEHLFNISIDIDILAGLLLHLACSQGQKHMRQDTQIAAHIEQHFVHELQVCKQAIREVNSHLASVLPEGEAYTLVSILYQVDILL